MVALSAGTEVPGPALPQAASPVAAAVAPARARKDRRERPCCIVAPIQDPIAAFERFRNYGRSSYLDSRRSASSSLWGTGVAGAHRCKRRAAVRKVSEEHGGWERGAANDPGEH